jgi:hypothetical protein
VLALPEDLSVQLRLHVVLRRLLQRELPLLLT